MKQCALCGSIDTVYETRKREIGYKSHSFAILQKALYCNHCGEAFLSPEDTKTTEREIADFKRSVEHLLTSNEIKQIRKRNDITQKEAAKLFGGGINAFSKYERGESIQSKSTDILLRLLDQRIVKIDDIRAIAF